MHKQDDRPARLLKLLEWLNTRSEPVGIGELAEWARVEFGVSEVTLRTDLAALADLKPIRKLGRGRFGAVEDPLSPISGSLFATRLVRRAAAKIAIAGAAVDLLVRDDALSVLLLDGGTTAYYVAELLSERRGLDLVVWTPSLAAAYRLAETPGVSARLLGGELQPDYSVVCGDETVRSLLALAGDVPAQVGFPGTHCVLDLNAISPDGGLLIDESREREQKSLMVRLADSVTIVADSSKVFPQRLGLGSHRVTELAELRRCRSVRLVSDAGVGPGERERLTELFRSAFPGDRVELQEVIGPGSAWVWSREREEEVSKCVG